MPEEMFDDQQPLQLDWKKYLAVAARRRWFFVVPFFVVWSIAWGVSWLMPAVYRSSTLILVERPTTSTAVPTNFSQDIQSRLDNITQQVLSRTRLLHIINNLNLFAEEKSRGKSEDDLVEKMRKNVEIELVRSNDRELTAFNIYFSASNPYVAQQVTTELTDALITENLEATTQNAKNMTAFLESQLEEARQKLAAQEQRVRAYKDQHIGELPTQLQSNIQILSGLQSQLQAQEDALSRARQQNAYLESLMGQYTSANRTGKPGDPSVPGLPAIDQELDRLRTQLADLSSHYTDQHPDVRKVKEQIAKAEHMKEQLTAELKNQQANRDNSTQDSAPTRDTAPIMEVRSQLKANQIEISNRQRSVSELEASIADYRSRLNRTPVREQELTDLTRDYDQSKAYYESLLARKNQSVLATNLAETQQGEHFKVQDPPSFPSKPFSPNRFKLGLMGLFIGLAVGVGVAGAAEFLDDRVYDEETFTKIVQAELIGEIPHMPTPSEEGQRKLSLYLTWAASAVMALVVLVGTAVSFLRG